jgi:hypothetical protein
MNELSRNMKTTTGRVGVLLSDTASKIVANRVPVNSGVAEDVEGSGLYQYGSFPQGTGITPYGGGIIPYGGRVLVMGKGVKDLFNAGKKMLSSSAKKAGKSLVNNVVKPKMNELTDKISNPTLRAAAKDASDVFGSVMDLGLKGNMNPSAYKNAVKKGVSNVVSKNKGAVMDMGLSQASKLGKKMLGGKLVSEDEMIDGQSYQDRPMKTRTDKMTQSNHQLMMLKDIIRSKPLQRTVR